MRSQKSFKRSNAIGYWLLGLLPIGYWLLATPSAYAAKLYLTPQSGEYQLGDNFPIEIRLDNENQCVNVISARIEFSKNLKIVDVSTGESIISLWPEGPTVHEDGFLTFVGGIPGGYCGRLPGDPGVSNILARVIFRLPGFSVTAPGEEPASTANVTVRNDSQVLLNDGVGTEASVGVQGAEFKVVETGEAIKNYWLEELRADITPPEPFEVAVQRDKSVFNGKFFAVFSAQDKQTGVAYYEVSESTMEEYEANAVPREKWKRASSPYVLDDQSLRSVIQVRVFDKAGNERVIRYISDGHEFGADGRPLQISSTHVIWFAGGLGIAGFIALAAFLWKRRRKARIA